MSMAFADSPSPPANQAGPGESSRQKRPAWDNPNDRASKRRAAQACLSCRNRKVRCDVVSGGHPCTNCRLDHLECVVKASNRGRKPATTSNTATTATSASTTTTTTTTTTSQVPSGASFGQQPVIQSSPRVPPSPSLSSHPPPSDLRRASRPSEYLVSLSFEDDDTRSSSRDIDEEVDVNVSSQTHTHHVQSGQRLHTYGSHVHGHGDDDDDGSTQSIEPPGQPGQRTVQGVPESSAQHLPPFIRRLPRHISKRDLEYLADKGALTIPEDAFRDELLRTYMTVVFPFMPTIDIEDFLSPIIIGDGREQVSLLLFQAVMFASVTFIDEKYLQARGFSSRKAARKIFFGRVRLLYGLDCEQNRIALLQAVLLMTYWYDCPDDNKDTWYWMGIALSLAQVIGFHREIDPNGVPVKAMQLRRRIWWSCIMRDRMLALGIRRPSRIRNEDIAVSPLTLDDFDLRDPCEPVFRLMGKSGLTGPNSPVRAEIAMQCVELSKLCVHLGTTLHTQYSVMGNPPRSSSYLLKATVFPRQSREQLRDLEMCDADLEEWRKNRDPRAAYTPEDYSSAGNGDAGFQCSRLHRALLHMIYLTTICVLHKPQLLSSESNMPDSNSNTRKQTSRKRVTEAAVAITQLAFHLHSSNQLRYLSTSSIPAFLSATLIHLLDVRSPDEQIRSVSIGRFHQCVSALQELQNMYSSADHAIHFLETVLRKTKISIPMMRENGKFSYKDNGGRSHAWESYCPTPDRGTPYHRYRVETAYPSPSSSRHHQVCNNVPEANSCDPFNANTSMIPPPSPLSIRMNAWTGPAVQVPESQDPTGVPLDPSLLDNWMDFDSLVPELLNFDTENNIPFMHSVPFT